MQGNKKTSGYSGIWLIWRDNGRPFKAGILLVVIFFLCLYSYFDNSSELILRECLFSPDKCKGLTLGLGNNTKIGAVEQGNYELLTRYGNILVKDNIESSHSNHYVNVILEINQEGEFKTKKIYVRRHRLIKILVSTVPALIIFVLFFRKFKFDFKKWMFINR